MPCMLVISNKGPLTPMAQLDWHFGKAAFTTLLLYSQKNQLKFNTLTCHFRALLNTWKVLHYIPFDCKSIWHEAMKSVFFRCRVAIQTLMLHCALYHNICILKLTVVVCWRTDCVVWKIAYCKRHLPCGLKLPDSEIKSRNTVTVVVNIFSITTMLSSLVQDGRLLQTSLLVPWCGVSQGWHQSATWCQLVLKPFFVVKHILITHFAR